MLQSLSIRDVVLIESLDLDFQQGLVVLTGETGAGKSILLDSLGLALGHRADTGLIRKGAAKASVTAAFVIPEEHPVHTLLRENEQDIEGQQIIIRRVLSEEGRNKCFINDVPVTQVFLKSVASQLIEIHGQFDHLLESKAHRKCLDKYGNLSSTALHKAYDSWLGAKKAYENAMAQLSQSKDREAFLAFSKKELEELGPKPGESDELAEARTRVAHRAKISEAAADAEKALNQQSVISHIVTAQKSLQRVEEFLPAQVTPLVETLDRAMVEIDEANESLRKLLNEVEGDTQSLEAIDDRLHALRAMAKKHHCSIDELPAHLEAFTTELSQLDQSEGYIYGLKADVDSARDTYVREADRLSLARRDAAQKLEEAIHEELSPLKLGQAKFEVNIEKNTESQWGAEGWDRLEFHVSTNPGSSSGAISKIASGGELSRFMLALKAVLSQTNSVPSLIFDEIDSGTGGAVAAAIGARLHEMSKGMQVLVITHSPQVAALGDQHLRVIKRVDNIQTLTCVEELSDTDRLEEIARMLSGTEITSQARAQAQHLMAVAS